MAAQTQVRPLLGFSYGLCVGQVGSPSTTPAPLDQEACTSSVDQMWRFTSVMPWLLGPLVE